MSVMEKMKGALKLQAGSKSAIEIYSEAAPGCGTVVPVAYTAGVTAPFPREIFSRSITLKMGQCPAQAYVEPILESIRKGEIDATDIITHTLTLEEGGRGSSIFDNKKDQGRIEAVNRSAAPV